MRFCHLPHFSTYFSIKYSIKHYHGSNDKARVSTSSNCSRGCHLPPLCQRQGEFFLCPSTLTLVPFPHLQMSSTQHSVGLLLGALGRLVWRAGSCPTPVLPVMSKVLHLSELPHICIENWSNLFLPTQGGCVEDT